MTALALRSSRNLANTRRSRSCTSSSGLKGTLPSRLWIRPAGRGRRSSPRGALLAFPLMKPDLDLMQLCFAHDPRQPQEQPIVVGCGIIETFAVGNQHTKQRTQFEQLMPISVIASET